MRHKVIETRQEIFNHNEHEVSKRWAFEEGVSANLTFFFFFSFRCLFTKITVCFLNWRLFELCQV